MPLNPLNHHYSMENPASIYDEEAMTPLELAGRTAAKVNEVVQAFNDLDANTTKNMDAHKLDVQQRINAQNARLDNFQMETIPKTVKYEMETQINDGRFDSAINKYLGGLEDRVDNLLGTVQEGSTTMDAEVIDIRTGVDGKTYDNSGTAVREQVGDLHKRINSGLKPSDMTFFKTGPQLFNKEDPNIGELHQFEMGVGDKVIGFQTHFIPVTPGKNYTSNVNTTYVTWYDELKNKIARTDSSTFATNKYVTAPEHACFAKFIGKYEGVDSYNIATGIDRYGVWEGTVCLNYFKYEEYIPDELVGQQHTPKYTLDIITNDSVNIIDKNDPNNLYGYYYNVRGQLSTEYANVNQTGLTPVEPGETYTPSNFSGLAVFYDKYGRYCGGATSTEIKNAGCIHIPENVYFARFTSSASYWDSFMVVKGTTVPSTYVDSNYQINKAYLPASATGNELGIRFTSYGDSITSRNNWQPHLVDYFKLNHTNLGIGSTTMGYVASQEETYPCMVNADRIQAIKDSNPDVITILGGANDASRGVPVGADDEVTKDKAEKDNTTFAGALSYLVEDLLEWKPTITIILITQPITNIAGYVNTYKAYAEATRKVAEYYGVPLVDMAKEIGYSYHNMLTYTSDGVHPNEAGGLKLANAVGAKIADIFRMR